MDYEQCRVNEGIYRQGKVSSCQSTVPRYKVTEQQISRRLLNGLCSTYAPEKRSFALRTDYSLSDLEGGLVRVKDLNKSLDETGGSHTLATGFKAKGNGQSGWSGGRGGKRDGKGCPPSNSSLAAAAVAVSAGVTEVSAVEPATAARVSAAAAAVSTTAPPTAAHAAAAAESAATAALSSVSAAAPATATRTALRGVVSITRLF